VTVTGTDQVLVEQHDRVLHVALNRPQARNAVDRALADTLESVIDAFDADSELGAMVLSGNGPAFCAGMDLKAFARGESPRTDRRGFAGLTAIPPDKPLLAAVEGPALGGGFELVLACDLVIAGTGARFGLPEVTRGLIASSGGVMRLPERIPHNRALEMMLTGDPIDAEQAHALGLVNRVVDAGQALATALELATRIAANGPMAVRAVKQVVRQAPGWAPDERFARQDEIADVIRASDDAREGALAFTEKRPPRWSGS
jgi:enoyl-CoA hydratase